MKEEEMAEERTEEKYACNEKPIMPLEAIGYKNGFIDGYRECEKEWQKKADYLKGKKE